MKRREFLKVSAATSLAAVAGLQSECAPKEVVEVEEPLFDDGEIYCSPEVMEDIKNWGVDEVDEKTQKEMMETFNSPPPSELIEKKPLKNLYENGRYDPRWNVNGSWNKVQNRIDLIYHLNGANHGFDKSYLNTLSTDELQKLHDDDHNKKKNTIRRRWFR
jgi:hypothetical protein